MAVGLACQTGLTQKICKEFGGQEGIGISSLATQLDNVEDWNNFMEKPEDLSNV